MTALNLALAFLLELAALVALGVWGAYVAGVGLAIAAPLGAAIIWGALIAPQAPVELPSRVKLVLACVVFALASASLIDAGHLWLGIALGLAFLANRLVLLALGER